MKTKMIALSFTAFFSLTTVSALSLARSQSVIGNGISGAIGNCSVLGGHSSTGQCQIINQNANVWNCTCEIDDDQNSGGGSGGGYAGGGGDTAPAYSSGEDQGCEDSSIPQAPGQSGPRVTNVVTHVQHLGNQIRVSVTGTFRACSSLNACIYASAGVFSLLKSKCRAAGGSAHDCENTYVHAPEMSSEDDANGGRCQTTQVIQVPVRTVRR